MSVYQFGMIRPGANGGETVRGTYNGRVDTADVGEHR